MQKERQQYIDIPDLEEANNEAEINVSPLFAAIDEAFKDDTCRLILCEGGVRSGKTYAIAQEMIDKLETDEGPGGSKIEIVRKTFPALKATAMEDFFDIMKKYEIYDENNHNKTDHIYREGKNFASFFSVDDEQKTRGRKRKYLWINEGNELEHSDYKQLALRTEKKIIIDFNPVDEDHWLYPLRFRPDAILIHSDYTCNPFLSPDILSEIEMMKEADPNYWRVFGLGLTPIKGTKIYTHYTLVDDFDPNKFDEVIYSIDFGFNVPSAIVRIGIKENHHTWDQLLYKTRLTNSELIEELKSLRDAGLITESMQGYADAAEPDRITEINQAGFNVKPADKSVNAGILYVKGRPLSFTKSSVELIDEAKDYSFKTTKDGKILDEPVKIKDHLMDAGRYGEFTHGKEKSGGTARIRIL